jgi:hypothetical protein
MVRVSTLRHACHSLLTLACAAACDGSRITEPSPPPDVRPFVTGAAAANLDAAGLFVYADPQPPDTIPMLSSSRARELAIADVRTWAPVYRSDWEQARGSAIDVNTLSADPRVYYVPTPYGAVPDGFHRSYTREFGPHYLVRMVSRSDVVLVVSVAAYATEVTIDESGQTHRPPLGRGGEFFEFPLPADTTPFRLLSPEEAVVYVGRLTGARTKEVPQLVQLGMPYSAIASLWKLSLDRTVRVRTVDSQATRDVTELYIGPERGYRLNVAAPTQPVVHTEPAFLANPDGSSSDKMETLTVPILDGVPTEFERVTIAP